MYERKIIMIFFVAVRLLTSASNFNDDAIDELDLEAGKNFLLLLSCFSPPSVLIYYSYRV